MKMGTTAVLAGLAAALVGYIVFIERTQSTTADLQERHGRLLPNFSRAKTTQIEVIRLAGAKTVAIQKTLPPERFVLVHDDKADATKDWRLSVPVSDAADADVLEAMLSALEWAEPRRTFEGISDADRKTFGLASPKVTVSITAGGKPMAIHFGNPDPRGQGVYASLDDATTAYILGKDVFEPFDGGVSAVRSKQAFRALGDAVVSKVAVDSSNATIGKMAFELRNGRWWATHPFTGLASQLGLEALVGAAKELRATRVLADAAAKDDALGASEKPDVVALTAGNETVRLRVGGPCPDHADERLAADADGRRFCLRQTDVDRLMFPAEDAREDRMFVSREDQVEGVRVESGGKTLTVKRVKDRWQYELGAEKGEASPESLGMFVRALQFMRALRYEDAPSKEKVTGTVTLLLDHDGKETVSIVGESDTEVLIRRTGEPGVAVFPKDVSRLFAASTVRFLSPRVLAESSMQAARVERTVGGAHEVATHYDGLWTLKDAPLLDMESGVIATTVEALSNLLAEQYVSDADDGSFGLDRPTLAFEVEYRSPEEKRAAVGKAGTPLPPEEEIEVDPRAADAPLPEDLPGSLRGLGGASEEPMAAAAPRKPIRIYQIRFGRDAGEDGVYARVNDGPVFVVAKGTVTRLLNPWKRAPQPTK